MRCRAGELPVFLVTVRPARGPSAALPGARALACRVKAAKLKRRPLPARWYSARCVSRPQGRASAKALRSGRQLFAAARAPRVEHLAAAHGRHAGAKPVPALAHDIARLVGALHGGLLLIRRGLARRGLGPKKIAAENPPPRWRAYRRGWAAKS